MENETIRTKFNEGVRTLGNKLIPRLLPEGYGRYGLGDFLNMKVNFRKTGAIAGASLPLAFFYGIDAGIKYLSGSENGTALTPIMMYIGTFPMSVPVSLGLGIAGYLEGKKLDNKLNSFREKIFQRK